MEVIDLSVFDGKMREPVDIVDGFVLTAQFRVIHSVADMNEYFKELKNSGAKLYLYKYQASDTDPDVDIIRFAIAHEGLNRVEE
jgi:hypothetical protein